MLAWSRFTGRLLLPRPSDKIFRKFNEYKSRRLTIVFSTSYPCNHTVHYKSNRFVVIFGNMLKNYCWPSPVLFSTFFSLDGEIRLRGSNKRNAGRVEIQLGGVWGRVAVKDSDIRDGDVICRQLGYHKAVRMFWYVRRKIEKRGESWWYRGFHGKCALTIFIHELSFLIQLNEWIKNRTKHFPWCNLFI